MAHFTDENTAQLNDALFKQEIIRPLAECARLSVPAIRSAMDQLGVSQAQIYRYIKRYRQTPCIDAFLRRRSPHDWGGRLLREVETVVDELIQRYVLGTREFRSVSDLHAKVCKRCVEENLPAPSERTLRRRLKKLPLYQMARAGQLKGPSGARDPHPRHHVVSRVLQEVQIDHTMSDVMIDLSDLGLGIYRPWLTLAIDVASRMVYGYYIGLKAPDSSNTKMVLLQGAINKTRWLIRRGFSYDEFSVADVPDLWPICGLPERVFTDRGKDFMCDTTRFACNSLGIETDYRPPGKCHFGGHIERLIGTFMFRHRMLLGATGSNVVARGDYQPERCAKMTIEEYEQWLILDILRYHTTEHSALGCTPLQKFNELTLASPPLRLKPLDPWRIQYAFLPFVGRRIGPAGVTLNRRTYSRPDLWQLDGKDVWVFYDVSDNRYVSLSLDGKSEHLCLEIEPDGRPLGHQDICELLQTDPKRRAETKRQQTIARDLRSAQMDMLEIIGSRKRKPTPKIVDDKAAMPAEHVPNTKVNLLPADKVSPFHVSTPRL